MSFALFFSLSLHCACYSCSGPFFFGAWPWRLSRMRSLCLCLSLCLRLCLSVCLHFWQKAGRGKGREKARDANKVKTHTHAHAHTTKPTAGNHSNNRKAKNGVRKLRWQSCATLSLKNHSPHTRAETHLRRRKDRDQSKWNMQHARTK